MTKGNQKKEQINSSLIIDEEGAPEPIKEIKWQARYYILLAALGGCLFGISNFIVGFVSVGGSPAYVIYPYAFGFTFFYLCFHIVTGYRAKRDHGGFFAKSAYLRPREGGEGREIWWYVVIAILIRAVIGFGTFFSMYLTVKNASLANANMAVLSSLVSGSMFMTAFAFYFLFKEKINTPTIVGMMLILLSAVVIAFKTDNKNNHTVKNPISILWPIYFAFQMAFF